MNYVEYTVKIRSRGQEYIEEWFLNGKLHRVDGPACINVGMYEFWCFNGEFHRVDGPAVKCANGSEIWYLNGKLHRVNGPAVKLADGTVEHWIEGNRISKKAFQYKLTGM